MLTQAVSPNAEAKVRPALLFVDDERRVLTSMRAMFRREYEVLLANSGDEAIEILADRNVQVVVSDQRMPEMTGVQLLSKVKQCSPNTVRMMLTGNSDQQTAIDAVNEGDIFRFLNKPCPPDKLWGSVEAALEQHRLITAERDLLENTLQGTIQVLAEVLALVNPRAFGRTTRIRNHAVAIARRLELADLWQFETMATLSQVGCVTVPDEVLNKVAAAEALSEDEQQLYDLHPGVAGDLLARIPRLEAVADAIRHQKVTFDAGTETPIGSRILRVVLDFERLESSGMTPTDGLTQLRSASSRYDPAVLDAFGAILGNEEHLVSSSV